jgi:hypothetical protein
VPVLVSPTDTAVPLNEVKEYLQKDLVKITNDDELLRFLRVAEAAIGHKTGPLVPEARVEKYDGGSDAIVLRSPVAVSLTSVTFADGTTSTLADYDLDPTTGILGWNYNTTGRFPSGRRNVTVAYTAGFAAIPDDLTQAVMELVRHLWKTQRGASTGVRPGFDDNQEPVPGAFSTWPTRVQELVAPFVAPRVG